MPLSGASAQENPIWVQGNRLSHDIIYMLMPPRHLLKPSEKCAARNLKTLAHFWAIKSEREN